jgi:hypothetical protein
LGEALLEHSLRAVAHRLGQAEHGSLLRFQPAEGQVVGGREGLVDDAALAMVKDAIEVTAPRAGFA